MIARTAIALLPIALAVGAPRLAIAAPADAGPTGATKTAIGVSDAGSVARVAPDADAPTVEVELDRKKVELGGAFHAFVTVTSPVDVQVNLPASLDLGSAFEETDRTSTSKRHPDGTVSRQFDLSLMAFEVGDLELPPIEISYAVEGSVRQVKSAPAPIEVVGVIDDDAPSLRDISQPVAVHRPDYTLLYVLAGTLGAAVLALCAWLLWRRRRRASGAARVQPAAPRPPPDEEALARLDALEASGALDAVDRRPAYFELSEIVRDYLGRRYGFPALDLTTGEIARELAVRQEASEACALLSDWLEDADLVKFAGYAASPEEARQALYRARVVVQRTSRPEQPAAESSRPEQPAAESGDG